MKPLTTAAAVVFSFIAVMHLLRLIFHWTVTVNTMIVPLWVSLLVVISTGVLAFLLLREAKK